MKEFIKQHGGKISPAIAVIAMLITLSTCALQVSFNDGGYAKQIEINAIAISELNTKIDRIDGRLDNIEKGLAELDGGLNGKLDILISHFVPHKSE